MAVALGKSCNTAGEALRARPAGPAEQFTLRVATFWKAASLTAKSRLDCEPLCRPEVIRSYSEAPR